MQVVGLVLRFLLGLICAFVLFSAYQTHRHPQLIFNQLTDRIKYPLDARVRYRIGELDPRFGVTHEELLQLLDEAALIWQAGTGRAWFVYDENAQLTVNLIYDERQESTIAKQQIQTKIDEKIKTQSDVEHFLKDEKIQLERDWNSLQNEIQVFNLQSELAHMRQDWTTLETLNAQREQLEQKLKAYKARESQYNQKINQYNQTQNEINADITSIRKKFPAREFHKGIFNGREINIYEFKSLDDLRLTLAHEFGHALDLDHHDNPEGLMHTHAGEQDLENFKLHSADLKLLWERHH
ncbi:MAG: matrixin family metalloprotease [Moraxella sp.]|nr:matrixin family metalloprotease [Moraxella sp.]